MQTFAIDPLPRNKVWVQYMSIAAGALILYLQLKIVVSGARPFRVWRSSRVGAGTTVDLFGELGIVAE
jgi:hypothetical protein